MQRIIFLTLLISLVSCFEPENEISLTGTWHFFDETDWVIIDDTLVLNEDGSFYSREYHFYKWMDTVPYNLSRYGSYTVINSSQIEFSTDSIPLYSNIDTLVIDTLVYHQCENDELYIDSFHWGNGEASKYIRLRME